MHDDDTDSAFEFRFGLALKERTAHMTAPEGLRARSEARFRYHRRRRVAVRGVAVVAATAAVLVGGLVVIDRPSGHRIEPAGPQPAGIEPGWYLPANVAALKPFFAQVLHQGLTYQEKFRAVLARPTLDGVLGDTVVVQLGDTLRVWIDPAQSSQYTSEAVTVAGFDGLALRDPVNDTLVVEYEIGDGRTIAITTTTTAGTTTLQTLLDIAGALHIDSPRALTLAGQLPDDYRVVASGDVTGSFGPAVLMDFVDASDDQHMLEIESQPIAPADSDLLDVTDSLQPITVRGVAGWYTSAAPRAGSAQSKSALDSGAVIWRGTDGATVRVGGSGMSRDQLIGIAENLRPVSPTEWLAAANTFPSKGPGLDGLIPSPPLAIPNPPAGYRLDAAHLDPDATADGSVYGFTTYVPIGESPTGQTLTIRLVRTRPEAWQHALDTTYAGRTMWAANGRVLVDTSPSASEQGTVTSQRTVAFEWIKGIVIEFEASTADGSAIDPTLDFDHLRAIAGSVNEYPAVYIATSTNTAASTPGDPSHEPATTIG